MVNTSDARTDSITASISVKDSRKPERLRGLLLA